MTYSYRPKGDHLTLYRDEKKVRTPKGNLVFANEEKLAQRIVEELTAEREVSDLTSLLCYHFTYCDLIPDYDASAMRRDLNDWCSEGLYDDPFLMFRRSDDDEPVLVAEQLKQQLSQLFPTCNTYQLVAIIVLLTAFDSLVLVNSIIGLLSHPSETELEQLISDLKTYCASDGEGVPKNIRKIISTFQEYWNIG